MKFSGENYHLWAEDAKIKLLEFNMIKAIQNEFYIKKREDETKKIFEDRLEANEDINATAKFKILDSIPFHLRDPKWA